MRTLEQVNQEILEVTTKMQEIWDAQSRNEQGAFDNPVVLEERRLQLRNTQLNQELMTINTRQAQVAGVVNQAAGYINEYKNALATKIAQMGIPAQNVSTFISNHWDTASTYAIQQLQSSQYWSSVNEPNVRGHIFQVLENCFNQALGGYYQASVNSQQPNQQPTVQHQTPVGGSVTNNQTYVSPSVQTPQQQGPNFKDFAIQKSQESGGVYGVSIAEQQRMKEAQQQQQTNTQPMTNVYGGTEHGNN